jgi:hypothetical protein
MHPLWARRTLKSADPNATVLDPFCGGGTVLIEARRQGLAALGNDINPVALRLARLRTANGPDLELLRTEGERCAEGCSKRRNTPFSQLASGETRLPRHVLAGLISLRDEIEQTQSPHIREILLFALSPLIDKFAARADRQAPRVSKGAVAKHFMNRVERWIEVYESMPDAAFGRVERADARWLPWKPESVDIVLTSPPYPGVLDYAGAQARRLQWLGHDHSMRGLVRKEIGRRSGNDDWADSMRRALLQISRVTKSGALVYMVVGDGVTRGQAVYTDRVLQSITRQLPLKFVASVSQIRPHFHNESSRAFSHRPRGEHFILWRRTGSTTRRPRTNSRSYSEDRDS